MTSKSAIIIGAGPAGLTAAYELLKRTDIRPVVLEATDILGGISRTVNYKGNRIDIGGHRFFSKSDRVMQWWTNMLPIDGSHNGAFTIYYQGKQRDVHSTGSGPDPSRVDEVMLVRPRKSRIYFLRRFFDYPLRLNRETLANLGLWRILHIGWSYVWTCLCPIRNERSLEDFFINRFGRELYLTFFKSYTEKVWGVPCREISAAWGAQRIKGLSVSKTILHAISQPFRKRGDVRQKNVETSLIEQFLYPKYGPGQMWETCGQKVLEMGGEIHLNMRVEEIHVEDNRITGVTVRRAVDGRQETFNGDYVFSTMPIKELVRALTTHVPGAIRNISEGLVYRDFITVGLLVKTLKIHEHTAAGKQLVKDNWIYIQEPEVRVGRLQIFNNWSPYMVADPQNVWIGLEYFCFESDDLWTMKDEAMAQLAIEELAKIEIIDASNVIDYTVIRMPKTYPAYFGTYEHFDELRAWIEQFENLFLIGRNGMHRYNNQDHSMLTAMTAVDNILAGIRDKTNLWEINTEQDYHEEKEVNEKPITK